ADFDDYCRTQEIVSKVYANKDEWIKRSIVNVARSGKFSSDRAVKEYGEDIWTVPFHAAK
ncbi:MAG: glycogen/starch/alpha-glucan phosphorylase, partial [Candidatus Omnitrophota bacterium]|nr:glycogen/starch/alpha-glucan phosphorylase [Candidatus Omnitrophota bacterium]